MSYQVIKTLGINLLRDFALQSFKQDFGVWQSKSDSHKSKKRLALRIDTTKTGKKYGKCIPGLEWLYDYVNSCYINTHEIFVVLVSLGRKNYIVDLLVMKKSRRKGWNILVQKAIDRLLKELSFHKNAFKRYCRLSLDGGFGHGETLKYLSEAGFRYAVVKSGGVDHLEYKSKIFTFKELEWHLATNGEFKRFSEKHRLEGEYCSSKVRLLKHNLFVTVVLRRYEKKNGRGYRFQMLISTNSDIYDYQIAQCYVLRWGIEDCIKECKDRVGITEYSYHTKGTMKNIEGFLALRFIGYMMVNWYRVDHCRPSRTSFWKLAERFQGEFTKMSYKALWNMFSP